MFSDPIGKAQHALGHQDRRGITTTNYDVRQPHLLTAKLLMEQVLAKL